MSEAIAIALVLAVAVAVACLALQRRYVFLVKYQGGSTRVARGKVTPAFLSRVAEACQAEGVAQAWVGGVLKGRRIALTFSRSLPAGCQQRLRNEWMLVG